MSSNASSIQLEQWKRKENNVWRLAWESTYVGADLNWSLVGLVSFGLLYLQFSKEEMRRFMCYNSRLQWSETVHLGVSRSPAPLISIRNIENLHKPRYSNGGNSSSELSPDVRDLWNGWTPESTKQCNCPWPFWIDCPNLINV